jgi:hypothetical protein
MKAGGGADIFKPEFGRMIKPPFAVGLNVANAGFGLGMVELDTRFVMIPTATGPELELGRERVEGEGNGIEADGGGGGPNDEPTEGDWRDAVEGRDGVVRFIMPPVGITVVCWKLLWS